MIPLLRTLRALGVGGLVLLAMGGASAATLKVMTYNVWTVEGSAAARAKIVQTIQAAGADVVGLQEMDNAAGLDVANQLGFHYHQQSGGDIQVLSRYPFGASSTLNYGVEIQYAPGAAAWLFNAHLAAYPYQPYDLRDGVLPKNEAAVIAAANAARGGQVTSYLSDMSTALAAGQPVFFTGDFNEPSHLDWTAAAAAATPRTFDLKVQYPASKRVVDAGMIDSFRAVRPNEVADPAYTWTPGSPAPNIDPNEVLDRIDFVYHRGAGVTPASAKVVGPSGADPYTDVAVVGYNSDHRAVVVEYAVPNTTPKAGDFNGDGFLNQLDWAVVRQNQFADLSGLSGSDAYFHGDLNADKRNDFADFAIFKKNYEQANGAGSFAELLASVPEPTTLPLAGLALAASIRLNPRRVRPSRR